MGLGILPIPHRRSGPEQSGSCHYSGAWFVSREPTPAVGLIDVVTHCKRELLGTRAARVSLRRKATIAATGCIPVDGSAKGNYAPMQLFYRALGKRLSAPPQECGAQPTAESAKLCGKGSQILSYSSEFP
jgi:hypothetical protein